MRKLTMALLALMALGVLTATAFAANGNSVWLCKGVQISGTGNNRCLILSENLELITLEDMSNTLPGAIECAVGSVLNEGWVGPGSEDELTKVEFMEPKTNCKPTAKVENLKGEKVANVCEKVENITVVHLPWDTLLYLKGAQAYVLIRPGSSGLQPGYLIECLVVGLLKDDECLTTAGHEASVEADNLTGNATELPLVSIFFLATLLSAAEAGTCSVGGVEQGLVHGEILLEAIEGSTQVSLEISEE